MPSITQRLPLLTRQHLHQDWCRIHRPCSCDRVRDDTCRHPHSARSDGWTKRQRQWLSTPHPRWPWFTSWSKSWFLCHRPTDKIAEANQCASRGHTRRSSHSRPFHTPAPTGETPSCSRSYGRFQKRFAGMSARESSEYTAESIRMARLCPAPPPCRPMTPGRSKTCDRSPREEVGSWMSELVCPMVFDPTPSGASTAAHCGRGQGATALIT